MDKIELDTRDRRNLYKEGAENVFALTAAPDEDAISIVSDVTETIVEAVEHMRASGTRFAYVVVRIEA